MKTQLIFGIQILTDLSITTVALEIWNKSVLETSAIILAM